jgi:hypothetical protein
LARRLGSAGGRGSGGRSGKGGPAGKRGGAGFGKGKGGGRQAQAGSSAKGKAQKALHKAKLAVKLYRSLPLLIPLLCMALVVVLAVGMLALFDDDDTQPPQDSDTQVAKYFPGDWQGILKDAAKRASENTDGYAAVPWTILAGLVEAQTDFGRYSPYDNVDRDPGRKSSPIPSAGDDGGGGDGGQVGLDGSPGGAGPGPVTGVTGPGSARSVGAGHPGPPDGDLSHQLGWFLYALRMHESGGNYGVHAGGGVSTACGAYQYIGTTWNNYGGYPTACQAPPSVQDKRATEDVLAQWRSYGTWQQVAMAHFFPGWAASPSDWNACPAGCSANPTGWKYVDDVMRKMGQAAAQKPAGGGGGGPHPAGYHPGPGSAGGGGVSAGVVADGCAINPTKPIGGEGNQGSGPYLLTPAAAGQMKSDGTDPQSPCDASRFVATQLVDAAKRVHDDPSAPEWKPNGDKNDQANARKYWTKIIEASGIFVDRGANPDSPCSVPPEDPRKPWSVSYRVISIWHCQISRMPELYLVTDTSNEGKGRYTYTVEPDRANAAETLINEAMSVSYGGSHWDNKGCDNAADKPQGIFPMTKGEAASAGLRDRCDVDADISAAAKLVLAEEKVPPGERDKSLGGYQPMIGGWQRLSIAMGTQTKLFAQVGPNRAFHQTSGCEAAIDTYLTAIAPYAGEFAKLSDPPSPLKVGDWWDRMTALQDAHGLKDPMAEPDCYKAGSFGTGFASTVAQAAVGLADKSRYAANLNGLSQFYLGKEDTSAERTPIVGQQTLVAPRLAMTPLKPIAAPVRPDATDAWSQLGTSEGVTLPVQQVAVEYAWFFGGVIDPFDSAGQRIGSLADGGGEGGTGPDKSQVTVGPDGCPKNVPNPRDLREGAEVIGVQKLCADSVRQARTPEAAKAIQWALSHLDIPYSQPQRNAADFADCSSFVSRAYRDSGAVPNLYPKGANAPTTSTFPPAAWMHQIPLSQAKPGDLVEPHSGHVAMELADGYIVHTNQTGDVSHVERGYGSAYWTGWLDPGHV